MQRTLLNLSVVLLFLASAVAIRAQAPGTVWVGVYTTDQAASGKAAYDANCSGCHGPYLEGFRSTGSAKALARDPFMDRWEGASVDELYQFIRENMPKSTAATASGTGKVSDETKVDIVAYILQVNDFPAGSSKLSPSGMPGIRIQSKDGIRALKSGMTVQVVGCASQTDGKWMLTRATEPMRTRNDALSADSELTTNAKKSGNSTLALIDAFPEPVKGQKFEVKGMFVPGQPPGINVLGLQKVAETCD